MRTLEFHNLSVRDNADDGTLTLSGLAVPWNETIDYGGMSESFTPDSFDLSEVTGKPLLWSHDRSEPIGHVTTSQSTPQGLEVEALVQPTTRGTDAILLLRSGSLKGLSIGFDPVEWKTDNDGGITYTKAKLHELSLTPLPAYESAQVSAVREAELHRDGARPAPVLTATRDIKPDEGNPTMEIEALEGLKSRLDQIEARMIKHDNPTPRQKVYSVREAFALQLADAKGTNKVRALADVVSSGNAGVLPPDWSREVRSVVDDFRYLVPMVGSMPFPAVGHTLTVPKISQHTLVAPRGTEKTAIPSRALTTGSDTYSAQWFAGGVDIALELLSQSDPSILAVVVDDLLSQYAVATDDAATDAVEAASTASGAALDFTNYGAFVAGVLASSEAIRVATGAPGDRLGLTTASWGKLIGLTDQQGRRILSTGGGTNADGSANLLASTVDVGGITAFHNPRQSVDLQFNTRAVRVAEKPPIQVQSDNVALMGRDVGILGAIVVLPLYPAGIVRHALTTAAAAEAEAKRK